MRNENEITTNLELTTKGKTSIIIAHRLSTVRNADRIYVLDKGTIVEAGSYEELMELDGIFSGLAKRQIA